MKTYLAAALVAASALATPALAQRAPAAVVVVVDTDRVYRECNACRTAQTQLQSQVTALRTRQQTLETQLRPEGQAIQTAVNALAGKQPDAALTNRVKAFQQRQEQANQELARGQQNIQSIQANVLRQINEKLQPVINQVMAQKGANVAVDVSATLAHGQTTNVTNDVLAALNRGRQSPRSWTKADASLSPSPVELAGPRTDDLPWLTLARAKIQPLAIEVRPEAPERLNVLIPQIDLRHLFGGYIAKLNLAGALAKRGHRVRLVAVDRSDRLPNDWQRRVELDLPCVQVRAVLDRIVVVERRLRHAERERPRWRAGTRFRLARAEARAGRGAAPVAELSDEHEEGGLAARPEPVRAWLAGRTCEPARARRAADRPRGRPGRRRAAGSGQSRLHAGASRPARAPN